MNDMNFGSPLVRNGSQPLQDCPFPVYYQNIVYFIRKFAYEKNLNIVSQAIDETRIKTKLEQYYHWNGGIRMWLIYLPLFLGECPLLNYPETTISVEQELSRFINSSVNFPGHIFRFQFGLIPEPYNNNITNQGRAHSSNIAPYKYEGFLFRSEPEILLFKALRDTGIPIMPLPVVASNRPIFKRIEPDFILIIRGLMFVVEVDGNRWHRETPAAAHERLSHLQEEGVRIIRVSASECKFPDLAQQAANKILIKIQRILESR